jgi:hypothetical protein
LIIAYRHNKDENVQNKEKFYEQLKNILDNNTAIILTDLKKELAINYRKQDTLLLDIENMSKSDNNTGLIHLCIENNLIIANTIFPLMKQLMYTADEASKNEKSVLDYITVRKESRKFIRNTKSSKRSEINSDHCLRVMEMDIN